MRHLLAAATAVALLLAVAITAAPEAASQISDRNASDSKRRAANYWHARRACPTRHVEIRWERMDNAVGRAPLGGCDDKRYRYIALNSRYRERYSPGQWCHVIVHEYGHLIGKRHSRDRDSVMHPRSRKSLRRCERFDR